MSSAAASRSKAPKQAPAHPNRFWALILGAVGVVYGDIGTSPIYAFKEAAIAATGEAQVMPSTVLGILSLIVWSLLLLVTLGNRYLPRPGAWMNLVKGLFGFVFLGMAMYMLRTVLAPALWLGLCGALLASLGHAVWSRLPRTLWLQPLAIALGLWGALMVIGAAGGASDPWRPLQVFGASANAVALPDDAFLTIKNPADLQRELDAAKAQGQWVLLDYYADWCVSCKIMEKQVFTKEQVLAALQGVRLLRLDVTADGADSRQLLERYQVPGPPSLLWIGPDGFERRSQRVTGEVDARNFVQHWTATRTQG